MGLRWGITSTKGIPGGEAEVVRFRFASGEAGGDVSPPPDEVVANNSVCETSVLGGVVDGSVNLVALVLSAIRWILRICGDCTNVGMPGH